MPDAIVTASVNTPAPATRRGHRSRGLICAVVALVLLAGGLGSVLANIAQRSEGGFFTTSTSELHTSATALVTAEVDVDRRRPADPAFDVGDLGRLRIRATSASSGAPIVIGVGPTGEVEDYLRGSAYDAMSSYEVNPLRVRYHRSAGQGAPPAPADQTFWVDHAQGSSTQTLDWDKRGGAWTAVIMNADSRPDVTVTAALGLRFGFLRTLGATLLTVAILLAAVAVHHAGRAARRPRRPGRWAPPEWVENPDRIRSGASPSPAR